MRRESLSVDENVCGRVVRLLPSALFWGKHCVHSESEEGEGIGVGKAAALLTLPWKPLR